MREKKKRSKDASVSEKRKIGGAVAALIAAVAVFAVMLQAEKNILTKYEKAKVYVTSVDIPKGQLITQDNLDTLFVLTEVDQAVVTTLTIQDPQELIGRVAAYDLSAGTLPAPGAFEVLDEIVQEIKDPVIAGFKAEDLYQVAGGVLRAGDRIHVYTVTDERETVLLWENVYVQGVFDQAGARIENGDTSTAAQRLNVYLAKEDVEAFYSGLASGMLRVVKVY